MHMYVWPTPTQTPLSSSSSRKHYYLTISPSHHLTNQPPLSPDRNSKNSRNTKKPTHFHFRAQLKTNFRHKRDRLPIRKRSRKADVPFQKQKRKEKQNMKYDQSYSPQDGFPSLQLAVSGEMHPTNHKPPSPTTLPTNALPAPGSYLPASGEKQA